MTLFFEQTLQADLKKAADHYQTVLRKVGLVSATPALVEDIMVAHENFTLPLSQRATIRPLDRRTLVIEPWDKSALKAVEAALRAADLNLLISVDSLSVRATLPPVTAEDKERLVKHMQAEKEKARIAVRTLREHIWKTVQEKEHRGELAEDLKFRAKDQLEKIVKTANDDLDKLTDKHVANLRAA